MTKQRLIDGFGRTGAVLGVAALAALAACGSSSAPQQGSNLASDLAAAGAPDTSSLTLAPVSGRTDVISAVERAPQARRAPRAASSAPTIVHGVPHHVPAPVAAPVRAAPVPVAAATPAAVAEAPQTQQSAPATAVPTAPRPHPVQQEQRHGRWRTEAEVIRDAPFPITP